MECMTMEKIAPNVTAPKGFLAAGVKAGIKKSGKEDVAIIYSEVPAAAAGVFTTNTMAAAPVVISRKVAAGGTASAVAVNALCANACTGEQGAKDAQEMAQVAAEALSVPTEHVFVASTGIIGQTLPMDKLTAGIKDAVSKLSKEGGDDACLAILTTDTTEKKTAYTFTLGGQTVTIAGMAKGSGMIHPNMATMLAFVTTDAAIDSALLQKALKDAVEVSFNMVSVDGDTSTNDSLFALANGMAGNATISDAGSQDYAIFADALKTVCTDLAKKVAKDGEGATKFLEVTVEGADDFASAKQVAMAIAKSPLVKTAFFGEDPNWGRIICAIGYSGVGVQPVDTDIWIGDVQVVAGGMGADFKEAELKRTMAKDDVVITAKIGKGTEKATVWTCDFSYEYVKINGEYHT